MSESFYSEGLHFECTRCSRCCRGSPGYVFLNRDDLRALAAGLGISARRILDRYCRTVRVNGLQRISLRERANYDCIFWRARGCLVYAQRPLQCRSYPFWPANLAGAWSWEELKAVCPGVGRGKLHSRQEIQEWLRLSREQFYLEGAGEGT
jgi:Fe-S-cluster containining protein